MQQRLRSLGWREIEVVDDDLGRSAAAFAGRRDGFLCLVAEVCLGKVGAVAAREIARLSRNNRDWAQLIDMCRVLDTLLVDVDTSVQRLDGGPLRHVQAWRHESGCGDVVSQ